MSESIISAYKIYIEELYKNGEERNSIEIKLREKLADESLNDDQIQVLVDYIDFYAKNKDVIIGEVKEIQVSSDIDGIRQTLRENAKPVIGIMVSLLLSISIGIILGYQSGLSGRIFTIFWMPVTLLVTLAARKFGQCVDGFIKIGNLLSVLIGFMTFTSVMQIVFESNISGKSVFSYSALEYIVFIIISSITVGPSGFLILLICIIWGYKFSVMTIGEKEIIKARKLQSAEYAHSPKVNTSDTPY